MHWTKKSLLCPKLVVTDTASVPKPAEMHAVYCLYRRFLLKAKSKLKCNFMSDWFGLLCTALSNRASYVKHKGDLTHSFPLACCQSNDPAPLFYFRTFFTFILAWDYTIDGTHYNPGRTQTYVPESQQRIYVLRMCTVYSSQWYRVKQIIVLFIYFIYIYI